MATNEMTSNAAERASSHVGTPYGKRVIIMMGEVKGIMENQKVSDPSGDFSPLTITTMARMRGMVTGRISYWVSASLSTAEPTAANMAA